MIKTRDILLKNGNSSESGYQLSRNDLSRLQNHLFKMYKEIEKICERHGLSVCLAYGNVIGAMRHNGWIPWDDDLDIHMPRKDYELFLTKYACELPDNYKAYSIYNKDGSIARFAKIVDCNTTFVGIGGKKSESSGVFIDIFPVDNIGRNSFVNKIKKYCAYFLMYTASSVQQVEVNSESYKALMLSSSAGKKNYYFRNAWGKIFGFASSNTWHKWIENFWRVPNDTGFVHIKSALSMCGSMVNSDVFFPCEKRDISIGTVYLPHRPEKYLDLIYGDWHKIPQSEDQWHHYLQEFNLPEEEDNK